MKKGIHPKYNPKSKVVCSCGATYEIGSTMPELSIEICSACHPFYSGTAKLIDTAGRVDRFKARLEKMESKTTKKASPEKAEAQTKKESE